MTTPAPEQDPDPAPAEAPTAATLPPAAPAAREVAPESIEHRIHKKRLLFSQQILLIEELKRIKRRPLSQHNPFAPAPVPQQTMDQINQERARNDRSGEPPLTIQEHSEFLRALKLFTVKDRVSVAGFERISAMVGRPAQLMRAHLAATLATTTEPWPKDHSNELKKWRMSLPSPPTLADVLGLKQLRCGRGRTVEEITTHLRELGGQDNPPSTAMLVNGPVVSAGLLERLLLDNQAVKEEMAKASADNTTFRDYLQRRFEHNIAAVNRLSPLLSAHQLAKVAPVAAQTGPAATDPLPGMTPEVETSPPEPSTIDAN
eukprot:TRINITY_DN44216_c0_g1_i1.p1 TRINITY_DN44216_c0_g1~~TRINITY_DN44216_c0_g1_i1.p1  ORF type:complete len:317 (+),score=67.33 TRINITY_DN44216_c0_g1_i1:131-1081(+)